MEPVLKEAHRRHEWASRRVSQSHSTCSLQLEHAECVNLRERVNVYSVVFLKVSVECSVGCPALQQTGPGRQNRTTGCIYDVCYKKLTRRLR